MKRELRGEAAPAQKIAEEKGYSSIEAPEEEAVEAEPVEEAPAEEEKKE